MIASQGFEIQRPNTAVSTGPFLLQLTTPPCKGNANYEHTAAASRTLRYERLQQQRDLLPNPDGRPLKIQDDHDSETEVEEELEDYIDEVPDD